MLRLTLLISLFLGLPFGAGIQLEHRENISRTLEFEGTGDRVLIIRNIFGPIHIEGYRAEQVLLEVEKLVTADNRDHLQEGISDISLGVLHTGDSIILYTESPYATLKRKQGKISYHWDSHSDEINYEWRFDYSIRVPYGTRVDVSTVNEGDVRINDTRATVSASNVNGSVFLEKTRAVINASTVNGTLACEILEKPQYDCRFHTINGDMNISCPSDLSADVSYETMHGDFYTDFDVEILPPSVNRSTENSKNKAMYMIEKNPKFRIGDGDVNFMFKTINGDMILKKKNL